jgi:hypothetical protein
MGEVMMAGILAVIIASLIIALIMIRIKKESDK